MKKLNGKKKLKDFERYVSKILKVKIKSKIFKVKIKVIIKQFYQKVFSRKSM